jgi:glycerol-3-phosphate O-acyltransferase
VSIVAGLRKRWRLQREAIATRAAVIDEIRSDARFRQGLDALAQRLERDPVDIADDAGLYLEEMVTVHSEALPDLNLLLSKISDRRSFEGVIQYDRDAVERLRILNQTNSLMMMTGHRSYLDFVVRVPFARSRFTREYRFAGANVLVWPLQSFLHSAGIVLIRRGFRDPLYAFVLRQYVGWLAEHRANVLWAIEGGRTRTGKLLTPKAGLLAYVAEAYVDGRASDISLVPATVIYEHLGEVFEYARYGRGGSKTGESLRFFLSFIRKQRRVPPQARISLGIGEPVSLGDFLDRDSDDPGQLALGISRVALEVSRRIDAVTPITPVALVLLPLLERDGVSMTIDELVDDLSLVLKYMARRQLPAVEPVARDATGVRRALDLLIAQGLVTAGVSGPGQRYAVTPGHHIEAAYYRNSIVHFFAIRSIAETALTSCACVQAGGRVAAFWADIERLRDLLEHEFFFPEGEAFECAVSEELAAAVDTWEATLESDGGIDVMLDALRPFFAPRTLAPFLEAYKAVADGLLRRGPHAVVEEGHFMRDCFSRARLDLALGRLARPDAVSLNMFETPLAVARARGLVWEPASDGRALFASTIEKAHTSIIALEAR